MCSQYLDLLSISLFFIIFKLATYSVKRLFCMFCTCSHRDPVCVARDESAQEGPDTSAGCRPHTQVLAPLQLCILPLFHSCVLRYSLSVFLGFRFIKGFICRHEEYCPDNDYFLDHVRCSFLKKLRQNLPKSVLDKSWPTPPPSLVEVCRKACCYYRFEVSERHSGDSPGIGTPEESAHEKHGHQVLHQGPA